MDRWWVGVCVCAYIYIYICVCVCLCVCVCACVWVCGCVWVRAFLVSVCDSGSASGPNRGPDYENSQLSTTYRSGLAFISHLSSFAADVDIVGSQAYPNCQVTCAKVVA